MTIAEAISVGFALGYAIALLLNRKPQVSKEAEIKFTLVIDPNVLNQINAAMVEAWLEAHGLTWMPKGAVFDPKREIKK